jgi:hypothetical protein
MSSIKKKYFNLFFEMGSVASASASIDPIGARA